MMIGVFCIPFKGSGDRVRLVVAVGLLDLMWAWAANSTGVIVWTIITHP